MRHVLSAMFYTLAVSLMLALLGVYVLYEYTLTSFIGDFWLGMLVWVGLVVAGTYAGKPSRLYRK